MNQGFEKGRKNKTNVSAYPFKNIKRIKNIKKVLTFKSKSYFSISRVGVWKYKANQNNKQNVEWKKG